MKREEEKIEVFEKTRKIEQELGITEKGREKG